jgi:hypothetical protein
MTGVARKLWWVALYAVAMAYAEAAVVVYLRALLHVDLALVVVVYLRALLHVDLALVSLGHYFNIEVGREAATIAMLVAVGWTAGRKLQDRLAYLAFALGLWDIWYYVWLAVLVGWPETLFDWDVLFLIPLPWWGPVLSPVLIALLLCVVGIFVVVRTERREKVEFTYARLFPSALGGLLALYVFMADAIGALLRGKAPFPAGHGPDGRAQPAGDMALAEKRYGVRSERAGHGKGTQRLESSGPTFRTHEIPIRVLWSRGFSRFSDPKTRRKALLQPSKTLLETDRTAEGAKNRSG